MDKGKQHINDIEYHQINRNLKSDQHNQNLNNIYYSNKYDNKNESNNINYNNNDNYNINYDNNRKKSNSFKNPHLNNNNKLENIHEMSFDNESMKEFKQQNFNLIWKNIFYEIPVEDSTTKKKFRRAIINNNTGYIKSGELLAVMGPSGCGKSSLLNFLTENIQFSENVTHTGEVYINSEKVNFKRINEISSYVMQDDVLFDVLTPKETLMFVAKLRSKKQTLNFDKMADDLLEELKLTKCKNTIIGNENRKGISGGERKRVSIGVEIISNPTILFLDEPTSGLDSQTSFIIIDFLKTLAETKNKAIIFTIHQPSSNIVNLFDRILLLNKGQCVYQGATENIIKYFEDIGHKLLIHSNPADAFMHKLEELNSRNSNILMEEYERNIKPEIEDEINLILEDKPLKFNIPRKNEQNAGFSTALVELMKRGFLNLIRNPLLLPLRFIFTMVFAFITCSIFSFLGTDFIGLNNRAGFLFFFTINVFFGILFQAVITFPLERPGFLRDMSSKLYTVFPYYLAKNLIETPIALFIQLIYSMTVYYIVGLRGDANNYFMFSLIFVVHAWFAQSMGFLFGAAFESLNAAMIVTQFCVLPILLFSGFLINQQNMPVWLSWIRFLSPFRYTLEAAMRNEADGNPIYSSFNIVNVFNLDIGLNNCIMIMVLYGLGLRILSYYFLKFLVRKLG